MYLLDTHTLVWAIGSPDRLPAAARAAVERGVITVSVISLWELITKKDRRTAPIRAPIPWWEQHVAPAHIEVLPVRLPHLAQLDQLPNLHGDPFDRMLVAQALTEGLTPVSKDALLGEYGVSILWA